MEEVSETEQNIDLSRGYGKALYGLSVFLSFCGSLTVLYIYLSFIAWAASGALFYIELFACAISTFGLLLGFCFFWSSKQVFSRITMVCAALSVVLGSLVLGSTLGRDKGGTNASNIVFVALPIGLSCFAAALSYFKFSQLSTSLE